MKRRLFAIAASVLSLAMTANAENPPPQTGDAAPAFEANDQDGNTVSSAELYKTGTTLLFFYPKAGTGG